jgi:hypothetical protein
LIETPEGFIEPHKGFIETPEKLIEPAGDFV